MRKANYLALLLTLVLALAACGQKAPEPKATPDAAENAPVADAQQAQTEEKDEVENNGGYYVRVNDKVYFRRYGADALGRVAVLGQFAEYWNVDGESEIVSLDLASGELTALYTEMGSGPLWYGDGGFYLSENYGGESAVFWYALDGSKAERVCAGVVLGVTEGGMLAVERADYDMKYRTFYSLYADKKPVAEAELTGDFSTTYAGVTDNGLFLVKTTNTEDDPPVTESSLLQITPKGEVLDLGALPELENYGFFDVQVDRFLAFGDKVAVGVGYYAGTGHFLNDMAFAEATASREGSVRELTVDVETEYEGDMPRLTLDESGALSMAAVLPGELRIDYEDGSLDVYEDGAWRTLAEGVCPQRAEGCGYRRIEQHMDYVGGTAYVTLACTHSLPQDDIGWREASALLDMLYLAVGDGGEVKELDCVDHNAELYGDVWFIEGESMALWRQRRTTQEEYYVPEYAYAIPIAEDADWMGGWEAVFDGTGLLDYDYGEGEADYYGYPVPDTEPAGQLCLKLDRDGAITWLANKGEDAVLAIDFDVPESELSGAAAKLDLQRRNGDEDTYWFWARLRVLEDGTRVRVERVPGDEDTSDTVEMAIEEGAFIPGETVYDAVLNCCDFVALRTSLPWHPELRVSVSRNGGWGEYVFGEDNWMHLETEESIHPEMTLAALPLPDPTDNENGGMLNSLTGTWLYRDAQTGAVAGTLCISEDGTALVNTDEDCWELKWALDRLYAETYQSPDLLCLSTEQPIGEGGIVFNGSAGDYLIELDRTDGEEVLHLVQANNGEGVLSYLFTGKSPEEWEYDFVFTRARGAGSAALGRRGTSFPAVAVRYDSDSGTLWLRDAEVVDSYEDGSTVWRASHYTACVAYPVTEQAAGMLASERRDDTYPFHVARYTVDQNGVVTGVAALDAD
ncbi:MAG: hypothetical protein E7422_04310 [Ruminococcaceae bacterium]|nr:hypothetical protein [Oscillospiraceae bacterium]